MVILKRSTSDTWRITPFLDRVTSFDVDIQPLEAAFASHQIDAVVHTACGYGRSGEKPSEILQANLLFGVQLLETSLKFKVGLFVNSDTFFNTKGSPQSHLLPYSLSKKQFVEWLREYRSSIKIANMRLQHMYGPKDSISKFVPWVISQFKANVPEIKLTAGEQRRNFVYVDDVVSAFVTVLKNPDRLTEFTEFNLGGQEILTLRSFLELLQRLYFQVYGTAGPNLNFGAVPYGKGEIMTAELDNVGLKVLGWEPSFTVEEGLKTFLKAESKTMRV